MRKQIIHTATSTTAVPPGGCIFLTAALVASTTALIAVALALASPARAAATGSDPVLAQIGGHKITQQEVDARIKIQLYDARKEALDQMVDDYLLQQAAKKDKLSVADYVKREVDDKAVADINDATAKKLYDDNKDKIPVLKTAGSYDKIKDRLIAALRQRDAQQQHEQLLARLRKDGGAKILLAPPRINVNLSAAGHPTLGPKNAPVTVIEFADFQCPFCKRSEDAVKAIHEKYGDRIQLVFMDFSAELPPACDAGRQRRTLRRGTGQEFWQFHDALFANRVRAQARRPQGDRQDARARHQAKFNACFDKNQYGEAIQKDLEEGHKLNVSGTPTFFIDGREVVGAQPTENFVSIMNQELAKDGDHNKKTAAAD